MSEGERQPLLANGPTNNAAAPSVAVTLPDTNVVRPPYVEHQGSKRAYMRDMILGVNDGLVSMFLLILGVSGGGLTTTQILLTGITGAAAGAVSMAAGEYLATKSQNEVAVRCSRCAALNTFTLKRPRRSLVLPRWHSVLSLQVIFRTRSVVR